MNIEKKISINSIIKRNDKLPFSKMDDEVVMLSIQNSEYYGMNKIGSRIWEIIDEPKKVGYLIEILTDEYEVNKTECEKDVMEYLDELIKKEVILLTNKD